MVHGREYPLNSPSPPPRSFPFLLEGLEFVSTRLIKLLLIDNPHFFLFVSYSPPIVEVNYNDTLVVHATNGLGDGPTSIHHHVSQLLLLFSLTYYFLMTLRWSGYLLQRFELLRRSTGSHSMRNSSWRHFELHRSRRSTMGYLLVSTSLSSSYLSAQAC